MELVAKKIKKKQMEGLHLTKKFIFYKCFIYCSDITKMTFL